MYRKIDHARSCLILTVIVAAFGVVPPSAAQDKDLNKQIAYKATESAIRGEFDRARIWGEQKLKDQGVSLESKEGADVIRGLKFTFYNKAYNYYACIKEALDGGQKLSEESLSECYTPKIRRLQSS